MLFYERVLVVSYRVLLTICLSEETVKQSPDDSDHQSHEPRLPQEPLEIAHQLLTLVVFPTFLLLDHGLAPVWCHMAPLATPEAGKRQLLPST